MAALSVLFVGGTGRISSACVKRAVECGFEVSALNRGQTTYRPLPSEVRQFTASIEDADAVRAVLGENVFDVVADFMIFEPSRVPVVVDVFGRRTGQFIFISSASCYQKPIARLPITESTPLANPYWQYSRNKIACEEAFVRAYRQDGFPVTIVRPSHTYDKTGLPLEGGWTVVERMRQGKPVVVHGDGTSLWVLTHHDDFARAFVRLLANPLVIGDTFHITSDEVLTWNQIYNLIASAAGCEAKLVHVPSDVIAREIPEWGPSLLGDKSYSVYFDNSKIRSIAPGWSAQIPFASGAREIIEWFDSHPEHKQIDAVLDEKLDRLIERYS